MQIVKTESYVLSNGDRVAVESHIGNCITALEDTKHKFLERINDHDIAEVAKAMNAVIDKQAITWVRG